MKEQKKRALTDFHRHAIQDAAEKLFLKHGVEATSIDDIAKESGYSRATLYVYFKSKSDIWNNILLSAMIKLKESAERAVSTDCNSIEKYYALCEAIAEFSDENPLYFESLQGVILLKDDEVLKQIFEAGEEIDTLVGQLITQGIAEGVVRSDVQFPHIVIVLWSSISGLIRMAAQKNEYFSETTGLSKKEFLRYGFDTLLRSITKEEMP